MTAVAARTSILEFHAAGGANANRNPYFERPRRDTKGKSKHRRALAGRELRRAGRRRFLPASSTSPVVSPAPDAWAQGQALWHILSTLSGLRLCLPSLGADSVATRLCLV